LPAVAKTESWMVAFLLAHLGQEISCCLLMTIFSKCVSHSSQTYSYIGIAWCVPLQEIEEFFRGHLRLPQNALQNRQRQVEPIVPRNRHPQMLFFRMPQLRVTPRLMMHLKTSPQQSAQNIPWFQNGQSRGHLGADHHAKLFFKSASLVRYALAVFLQSFQMAADGIPGHLASFIQSPTVSDQPWQHRNGDLISGPGRILSSADDSTIPATSNHLGQRLEKHGEAIIAGSRLAASFFSNGDIDHSLSLCPMDRLVKRTTQKSNCPGSTGAVGICGVGQDLGCVIEGAACSRPCMDDARN